MNSIILKEKVKSIVNLVIARCNKLIIYFYEKQYFNDTDFDRLERIRFDVIELDKIIKVFSKEYGFSNDDTKKLNAELLNKILELQSDYFQSLEKAMDNVKNSFMPKIEEIKEEFESIIEYLKLELNKEIDEPEKGNATNLNKHYMQWNNEIKELSYLFFKLKEEGVIKSDNLGMALSQAFINEKGEKVLNTKFNSNFSKFSKSEYPKNATHIDKLVNSIKKPR